MRRSLLNITALTLAIFLMTGCRLQEVPFTDAVIHVTLPDETVQAGYDGYQVKLTNIATGRTLIDSTNAEGIVSLSVEEGVYNIEISGEKTITTTVGEQTFTQTLNISGLLEKSQMLGNRVEETIPLLVSRQSSGLVIKEIYYAGSTTPKSGSYYQDQFIEIYNNSDSVQYADGLSIAESQHLSNKDVKEFEDYPNDLIVGAVYTVPGDGKTYPVQPGKSIVIASLGIDHTAVNANSPVNLSKADFEWYDSGTDVDVPTVTNMIRAFCYSNTIWLFHVKGYHAYVIFKQEGPISDFITQNTINVMTTSGSTISRIKVANSLIMDGVELSLAGTIGSKSLSSSIDASYTYCDGSFTGKCVRRKVKEWKNGRAILLDTNNSGNDFIPNATPKPWEVE